MFGLRNPVTLYNKTKTEVLKTNVSNLKTVEIIAECSLGAWSFFFGWPFTTGFTVVHETLFASTC